MSAESSSGKILKEKLPKISLGTMFTVGLSGYGAISDYKDAREDGYGKVTSVAKAATSFAVGEVLGGWMIPAMMLPAIPQLGVNIIEGAGKLQRQMDSQGRQIPFTNSHFNDFNQAFTMRQAGMKMAQASQYNLQQTLMGNEASYLR